LSITVDTNILVYAANASDPAHREARDLLERLGRGPELLFLFWPAIMGFLRISTSPGIFAAPYTPAEALAAISDLIERPHVRTPTEEPGFLGIYRSTAPGARGALVPDAHLAALMRQHGVAVIYTRDRGFRRFDGISVRDPFA
jgi:toxin-antitoxin system PIN domain toxin